MTLIHTSQRNCPSCKSRRVLRSHRHGLIERYLLSAVRIRPYRCDVCDSRFYKSDLPMTVLGYLVDYKNRIDSHKGKSPHSKKAAA